MLVVDDKTASAESLYSYLADWGIEPEKSVDIDSALTRLRLAAAAGRPFRLVLLSDDLPEGTGRRLAELIKGRTDGKEIRIILITALDSVLSTEDADRLGISGQITRPIRQSRLFDSVMEAMVEAVPDSRPVHADGSTSKLLPLSRSLNVDKRILVAEDNEVNQFVTSEILAGEGFRCDIVSTGRQGLLSVKKNSYSCDPDGLSLQGAPHVCDRHGPLLMPTSSGLIEWSCMRARDVLRTKVEDVSDALHGP